MKLRSHTRATLSLLAVLGLVGACRAGGEGGRGWGRGDQKQAPAEEQAAAVVVGGAAKGAITAEISAASTIEAEQQVTVHAEATGRVLQLEVEEGDLVKKGQLLARVKADMQASGLNRATGSQENARIDYERVKTLYAQQAASKQELDAARVTYENAQIDVSDRRRDVRNTKVVAPFAGKITERFVNTGAFVTSGQQLVSITDFNTLVARVYIPEKELDRVRVGQPAEVIGKAARGRRGTGTVTRIAPVVDAATGTVKVTVALPSDLAGGATGFLPGMYAEVTLTTERREGALLVPKPALVHDDDQAFVYVVDGNRAARRQVTTGLQSRDQIEVLEGLEVGTEIVIVGQSGLKDGALIRRVDAQGNPLEPDPGAQAADETSLANGHAAGEGTDKTAEGA